MRTILRAYASFRWMDVITPLKKVTKATTRQKIMVIRIHKSSKRKNQCRYMTRTWLKVRYLLDSDRAFYYEPHYYKLNFTLEYEESKS